MNSVVAVYDTHSQAEDAIKDLQQAGVGLKSLSIVGKDIGKDEHVIGYYNTGDRMKYWGKIGAFWGGLWGLLLGSALFVVPGVGPVLVAGPLVAWIVAGLEGAVVVGGLSAIGAGLFSIGIPKDSVLQYEVALKANKFVLVVHGSPAEVERARQVISESKVNFFALHGESVTTSGKHDGQRDLTAKRLDAEAEELAEKASKVEQSYDAAHPMFTK